MPRSQLAAPLQCHIEGRRLDADLDCCLVAIRPLFNEVDRLLGL